MNVIKGDITKLDVDIIVNAANKSLLGGGGVDGAIHALAGKELLEECKKIGGCNIGDAVITNAYNLPCKKIIHTVGPIYYLDKENAPKMLKSCYKTSMSLAEQYRKENNLSKITIAFPCISTGVYSYPKKDACILAINTIKEINNKNIEVIFVCFDNDNYNIYKEELQNE